jgi:hypothetical protein
MSPIPLTLIGIIPGHLIMGAEFTATSMIGLIALGGIIVRQSILIVEFVKIEVEKGKSVREAAVAGAEIRMRPILITSLTLMAGAWAIIYDPIFQGMAVSLLFGAGVATLMAVIVIPLGCISLRRHFYLEETESGEIELSGRYAEIEEVPGGGAPAPSSATPLWLRAWSGLVSLVFAVFGLLGKVAAILGVVFLSLWRLLQAVFGGLLSRRARKSAPRPPPGPGTASAPPGGSPAPGGAPGVGSPGPRDLGPGGAAPESAQGAIASSAQRPSEAGATAVRRKASAKPVTRKKAASRRGAAKKTVTKKSAAKKRATKKAAAKRPGAAGGPASAPGPGAGSSSRPSAEPGAERLTVQPGSRGDPGPPPAAPFTEVSDESTEGYNGHDGPPLRITAGDRARLAGTPRPGPGGRGRRGIQIKRERPK